MKNNVAFMLEKINKDTLKFFISLRIILYIKKLKKYTTILVCTEQSLPRGTRLKRGPSIYSSVAKLKFYNGTKL